jgi:hypothetical protein
VFGATWAGVLAISFLPSETCQALNPACLPVDRSPLHVGITILGSVLGVVGAWLLNRRARAQETSSPAPTDPS